MAVVTLYGVEAPVPAPGSPAQLAGRGRVRAEVQVAVKDHAQFAVGNTVASVIVLGDVDWNFIPFRGLSTFWFDDAGTGQTLSIGDATYPTGLVNAQDIASAAGSASMLKSVDISNDGKRLWEMLGYASRAAALAVSQKCRLIATLGGADVGAACDVSWELVGTAA